VKKQRRAAPDPADWRSHRPTYRQRSYLAHLLDGERDGQGRLPAEVLAHPCYSEAPTKGQASELIGWLKARADGQPPPKAGRRRKRKAKPESDAVGELRGPLAELDGMIDALSPLGGGLNLAAYGRILALRGTLGRLT